MARLIRMDGTGHTTLAEWTAQDDTAFEEAVREFTEQQDWASSARCRTVPGRPRTCASCRARPIW